MKLFLGIILILLGLTYICEYFWHDKSVEYAEELGKKARRLFIKD